MLTWLQNFYTHAKTKLTTYLATLTAAAAELPNVVNQDALNAINAVVPPQTQHHIVAALAGLTIWSRIRRLLKTGAPPAATALLLAALAAIPAPANASGPNTATLSWTLVTTRTDGSTISGAVTYNVYQGATGAEVKTQSVASGTSTLMISTGLAGGTTVCWKMTAVETATGLESSQTNEACKTFPQAAPTAPTTLTVQ